MWWKPNVAPAKRREAIDLSRTALRIIVGIVFAAHGFQKLAAMDAWTEVVAVLGIPSPAAMAWLAVLAEFLGGIGLILGAFTRLAALTIAIDMIVAIATVHAGHGLMLQQGGLEYPLIMLALMTYFIVAGAGPYSLDAAFRHVYGKHTEAGDGMVHDRRPPTPPPRPSCDNVPTDPAEA
jgi:putative oxidoreductase